MDEIIYWGLIIARVSIILFALWRFWRWIMEDFE